MILDTKSHSIDKVPRTMPGLSKDVKSFEFAFTARESSVSSCFAQIHKVVSL